MVRRSTDIHWIPVFQVELMIPTMYLRVMSGLSYEHTTYSIILAHVSAISAIAIPTPIPHNNMSDHTNVSTSYYHYSVHRIGLNIIVQPSTKKTPFHSC